MSDTLRVSNIHFGNAASNYNQPQMGYTSVGIGSTANYGFLQFFGTSNTLCWTANGTVGIGTTAPLVKLQCNETPVNGDVTRKDMFRGVRDGTLTVQNAVSMAFALGASTIGISPYGCLDIKVNGLPTLSNNFGAIPDVTVMSVIGNGNVGIGITNPTAPLTIGSFFQNGGTHPDTYGSNILLTTTAGFGVGIQLRVPANQTVNSSDLQFTTCDNAGAQVTRMTILGSSNIGGGFVGIGTTAPRNVLDVNGNISLGNRLLGTVDSAPTGNFWIGLNGTATESDRLAIGLVGNQTTGVVSDIIMQKNTSVSGVITKLGTTSGYDTRIAGGTATNSGYVDFVTNGISRGYIGNASTVDLDLVAQNGVKLNFYTAGTNRMTIATDGNVGIGTVTPTAGLHIKNPTSAMRITGNLTNSSVRPAVTTTPGACEIRGASSMDGADDGFLRLSAGGGSSVGSQTYIDLSGYSTVGDMSTNIIFGVLGSERMRIAGTGNVGIGTNNPIYRLQIEQGFSNNSNGLFISNTNYGSMQGLNISMVNAGSSYFSSYAALQGFRSGVAAGSTPICLQPSSGNVGIGVTNPGAILQINDNSVTSASFPLSIFSPNLAVGGEQYLLFGTASSTANQVQIGFRNVGAGSSFNYSFIQNFGVANAMCWRANGNVGIGITNPDVALHVVGGLRATAPVYSWATTFSYYTGNATWNPGNQNTWPFTGNMFLLTLKGNISVNNVVNGVYIVSHSRGPGSLGSVALLSGGGGISGYSLSNDTLTITFNSSDAQIININFLSLN